MAAPAARAAARRLPPPPPPPLALLCLLLAALLPLASAAADAQPQLSDALLYRLLYEEPNQYLSALGNISDHQGSLSRTFLSPAHRRAAGKLRRWMAAAGMRTWADQVANVHGSVAAADPSAPAIIVGSHYDTVHDGGAYDGALGIIAGICAVKAVLLEAALAQGLVSAAEAERAAAEAGAGQPLDLADLLYFPAQSQQLLATPVRVVAFSDEEGVRFHSTYLGSRALVGTLLDMGILSNTDSEGVSVVEALEHAGFDPSPPSLRKSAIPKEQIRAYVEVHMEQGPVLEAAGHPLGPVAAIAGQSRLQAEITGVQGHAGTVPMRIRRDPMAAAAELISLLERLCNGGAQAEPHSPDLASDESLVCTVGSVTIWPNAGNVIPGATNFTLDIRSRWDTHRKRVISELEAGMAAVCKRRGVTCRLHVKNEAATVEASPEVVQGLREASEAAEPLMQRLMSQHRQRQPAASTPPGTCSAPPGGGAADSDCAAADAPAAGGGGSGSASGSRAAAGAAPLLVSGAGHDAMVFADVTRMGMLFVRCRAGISHSPLEYVAPEDVAAATAALYQYLRRELLPPPKAS